MPELDPITAAIEASVASASEPAETPEVVDDGGSETPEVVAEEVVSPSAEKPAVEAVDPLTKELEDLGLKEPKAGERENRLPYSRVKKIVENARKKQIEAHTAALKTEQEKYTKAEARLKNLDNWDRLIANDPDRAISELARLHPTLYQKFLTPPVAAEVKQTVVDDPKPSPDWKYEDGSLGYSPEGQQKLLEWNSRETERRVTKNIQDSYDKRFGPMEKQWQAQQVHNQNLPKVRAQIQASQQTWGELFTKNEPEILAYLEANPQVSFADCVAAVLVPKVQVNRDSMRADLMKEINARPAAARRAAPVAAVAAAASTEPRSMEDVIKESIKGLN
jgi:hypothetical protein